MGPRAPTLAVGQETDLCLIFENSLAAVRRTFLGLADEVAVAPGRVVRPRRVPESSLYKSGIADDVAGSASFR